MKTIDFGIAVLVSAGFAIWLHETTEISTIDGFGILLLTQILWRVCK